MHKRSCKTQEEQDAVRTCNIHSCSTDSEQICEKSSRFILTCQSLDDSMEYDNGRHSINRPTRLFLFSFASLLSQFVGWWIRGRSTYPSQKRVRSNCQEVWSRYGWKIWRNCWLFNFPRSRNGWRWQSICRCFCREIRVHPRGTHYWSK